MDEQLTRLARLRVLQGRYWRLMKLLSNPAKREKVLRILERLARLLDRAHVEVA